MLLKAVDYKKRNITQHQTPLAEQSTEVQLFSKSQCHLVVSKLNVWHIVVCQSRKKHCTFFEFDQHPLFCINDNLVSDSISLYNMYIHEE